MIRALPPLLALLVVAGCQAPPPSSPQAQADAATRSACLRRADDLFTQQNRADIYSPPPQINAPSSGTYSPGVLDRGLSQQFAHDRYVADCIRNFGTGEERSPAEPSAPLPPLPPRR